MSEEPTIVNLSAKPTPSQIKFNRRMREERGNRCEICGATADQQQIEAHHVLDRRAFPQFAKTPENIIVACQPCHVKLTDCIGDLEGHGMIAYGALPPELRSRTATFVEQNAPRLTTLIQTLRRGRGYALAVFWWRMENRSPYPPEAFIRAYEQDEGAYQKWLESEKPSLLKPLQPAPSKHPPKKQPQKLSPQAQRNYEALTRQYREAKGKYGCRLKGLRK